MSKIKFDIVTPRGSIYSADVEEVTATGSEGEFGVLPGHAPFITTLKSGLLSCVVDGKPVYFFSSWGYAEVGPDRVTILADSAERSEDIDVERAMAAKRRAEEDLRRQEEETFASAEASLERAMARIHVKETSMMRK